MEKKPLLWRHRMQSQSTMLKKKARGGRSEGMEASLLDRKRQRQQNKGWEAMCLLSTDKHTTEGGVCRLKDKDGARSNNYEIATVK